MLELSVDKRLQVIRYPRTASLHFMPPLKSSRKPSPIHIPKRRDALNQPEQTELTSQQIYIWEHAALLYHGYEWQAAADEFQNLSRTILNIDERTRCLVNTGIIHARLGDYNLASNILEEAANNNPTFLLAHFLLAIFCCELGDGPNAKSHIEKCLDGLHDYCIDNKSVGLGICLGQSDLRQCLQHLESAQTGHEWSNGIAVPPYSIPAEYIFEAPHQARTSPEIEKQNPRWRDVFRKKLRSKIPEDSNASSQSRDGLLSRWPGSWNRTQGLNPAASRSILYERPLSGLTQSSHCAVSAKLSMREPVLDLSNTPWQRDSQHQTWHRRPRTPFTPRDARFQDEFVSDFASFIRHCGRKDSVKTMIPKDAKGECWSKEQLSQYVHFHSPRIWRDISPKSSRLHTPFLAESALDHDNQIGVSLVMSPLQPASSLHSPESSTLPSGYTATHGLLLPTSYENPLPVSRTRCGVPEEASDYSGQTGGLMTPINPTPSSSDFCRGATSHRSFNAPKSTSLTPGDGTNGQRMGSLKSDKALPPTPDERRNKELLDSSGNRNTVSTDEFVERVLECSK